MTEIIGIKLESELIIDAEEQSSSLTDDTDNNSSDHDDPTDYESHDEELWASVRVPLGKNAQVTRWVCKVCNRSFSRQLNLDQHLPIHKEAFEKKITMIDPFEDTNSWTAITVPVVNGDEIVRWLCKICNRSCKKLPFLVKHLLRTHDKPYDPNDTATWTKITVTPTPKKKFIRRWLCKMCQRSFASPPICYEHLRQHDKTETDADAWTIVRERSDTVTRWVCKLCDRRFIVESNLNQHLRSHKMTHNDYDAWTTVTEPRKNFPDKLIRWVCKTCNNTFGRLSNLKQHLRVHNVTYQMRKKEIVCHVCDRTFGKQSQLKYHMYKHTKESYDKPYKCEVCNKGYNTKTNLRHHMKTKVHLGRAEGKPKRVSRFFPIRFLLLVCVRVE